MRSALDENIALPLGKFTELSAIALMGEPLLLPPDLSHREWVKFRL